MLKHSASQTSKMVPPVRPEFVLEKIESSDVFDVSRPLSSWERMLDNTAVRRLAILLALAAIWEVYAVWLDNPLMVPPFTDIVIAFWNGVISGELLTMSLVSLQVLIKGYVVAIVLAGCLTALAVCTRFGNDLLATLISMFNPLPAIALLPMALLWFGMGEISLIFVLIHAVLWPVALNTLSGFMSVSETLRMCGRNYGLGGTRYVALILIPAALPSILTGLKIGWAFAWRTLIAAELVFGVSSGSGGLGWFIFLSKNQLMIADVFAGLSTVIFIGLVVENVCFRWLEENTVRKWGMAR